MISPQLMLLLLVAAPTRNCCIHHHDVMQLEMVRRIDPRLARISAHPRPPKKLKPAASGTRVTDWIGGVCHADRIFRLRPSYWHETNRSCHSDCAEQLDWTWHRPETGSVWSSHSTTAPMSSTACISARGTSQKIGRKPPRSDKLTKVPTCSIECALGTFALSQSERTLGRHPFHHKGRKSLCPNMKDFGGIRPVNRNHLENVMRKNIQTSGSVCATHFEIFLVCAANYSERRMST